MPRDITSRQIKRPAQRDDRVGEIAADAVPAEDHFRSGKIRPPGTETVFDIVMHPIADGLHARQAVGNLPELVPREIQQLV